MDAEAAERLKREWTGKRVAVRGGRPSLARFAGRVGEVVTVNMNGRALVRLDRSPHIGWTDIDPADLEVVADAPPPTAGSVPPPVSAAPPESPSHPAPAFVAPTPAATASRPKTQSILELARQQGAAKSGS